MGQAGDAVTHEFFSARFPKVPRRHVSPTSHSPSSTMPSMVPPEGGLLRLCLGRAIGVHSYPHKAIIRCATAPRVCGRCEAVLSVGCRRLLLVAGRPGPRVWRDASWHVSFAIVRAEPQDAQLMHSGRPTNKASRLAWSCLTMEAVHVVIARSSQMARVWKEVPGARDSRKNLVAGRIASIEDVTVSVAVVVGRRI